MAFSSLLLLTRDSIPVARQTFPSCAMLCGLIFLWTSTSIASSSTEVSIIQALCPTSRLEWLAKREALRHSGKVTDAFALGKLFSDCAGTKVAQDKGLVSCFKGLFELSQLLETAKPDWISLENSNRLRNPNQQTLPQIFQSSEFWSIISSRDEKKITERLRRLNVQSPGIVSFRYQSHLQPKLPIFISVIEQSDFLWIIDYDTDLNINAFIEQKRRPGTGEAPLRALVALSREDLTDLPSGAAVSISELNGKFQQPLSDQGGRCYQCHQAPVLPIAPLNLRTIKIFSSIPNPSQVVTWFNRTYAQRSDGFPTDRLSFLPDLGDLKPEEARVVLENCWPEAKGLLKIRALEAMQCSRCHSQNGIMPPMKLPFGPFGKVSGKTVEWDLRVHRELSVNSSLNSIAAIPQLLVSEGHMPPDFEEAFTPRERDRVFKCLMQDYFGPMFIQSKNAKREGRFTRSLLSPSCKN